MLIYTLDINRLYTRSSRFSSFRDNSECEASPETVRANNVHCYLPPDLRARVNSIVGACLNGTFALIVKDELYLRRMLLFARNAGRSTASMEI